ncbi:unnamed protein product, partial [Symbiodinium necroappetens]
MLAKAFEKEKLIRKRFRVKKGLLDFPPAAERDDADKAENPISTKAMEMNCTALRVMVAHYKVLSGKKAKEVRELFASIQSLRDEQADTDGDDGDDDDEGGEEEAEEDDEVVEENSEGYETDDGARNPDEAEDSCSSEPKSSKASSVAKGADDDGCGVGAVVLDSQEDAQVHKDPCWRYRTKSSLQTLPSTVALGASPPVETPASYVAGLPTDAEEELQRVLQQIALEEGGGDMSPEIARHERLLVRMGTPEQASKPK